MKKIEKINDKISAYEANIELLNKEIQSKEKIINDSININEKINMKMRAKEDELKKYFIKIVLKIGIKKEKHKMMN